LEIPPVQYARSGDTSIAYQVTGERNPIDVVFAPGTVSHNPRRRRPGMNSTRVDQAVRLKS
jgi:hypothetical protein